MGTRRWDKFKEVGQPAHAQHCSLILLLDCHVVSSLSPLCSSSVMSPSPNMNRHETVRQNKSSLKTNTVPCSSLQTWVVLTCVGRTSSWIALACPMQPAHVVYPGRQIPQNGHLSERFSFSLFKSGSLAFLALACFPPRSTVGDSRDVHAAVLCHEIWEQHQVSLRSADAIIKKTIVAITELNSLGNW